MYMVVVLLFSLLPLLPLPLLSFCPFKRQHQSSPPPNPPLLPLRMEKERAPPSSSPPPLPSGMTHLGLKPQNLLVDEGGESSSPMLVPTECSLQQLPPLLPLPLHPTPSPPPSPPCLLSPHQKSNSPNPKNPLRRPKNFLRGDGFIYIFLFY